MALPADVAEPTSSRPWLREPLGLRPGVEILTGANDERMLFVPDSLTYVRLTSGAARLVALIDGRATGEELADRVSAPAGAAGERVRRSVIRLLEELRRAGALTVPAEAVAGPERGRPRTPRYQRRLPLTRSLARVVRRPGRLLRRVPYRLTLVVVVVAVGLAVGAAVVGLVRSVGMDASGVRLSLGLVIVVLLVQAGLHEIAHAVVGEALDVPVREAGLVLWWFVLPVPYVDCTDAYRLRGRGGRVAIALAGPVVDVLAIGVSATVWSATGATADSAVRGLLLIQLLVLVTTVNPILPGDGHHAVAAAAGEFNLRGRAFLVLAHLVLRRPLPRSLAVSRSRRAGYLAYAVLSVAYFVAATALLVGVAGTFVEGSRG